MRPRDIQRAMLDINPHIIHFSGHGTGDEGLVFEDETRQVKLVDGEALAALFQLFADQVECVVLNGCYSKVQALAITQHINYVIGMGKAIGDQAAIEFAVGFYDALGAGRSFEFAYKLGRSAIQIKAIPEYLTPVLFYKGKRIIPSEFSILIDISHNQKKWDYESEYRPSSLFDLAKPHNLLLSVIHASLKDVLWDFGEIEEDVQLGSKDLQLWRGLIFGIPHHKNISQETRDAIVAWVRHGGRLLMLGYELGERHHETNLNWLADEFGLRFNSDIVAPENYTNCKVKPYKDVIKFSTSNSTVHHPVLEEVEDLCMRNICTLTVEPGSSIILTVGNNGISRPINPHYTDGRMRDGGNLRFELNTNASWVPVAAEAPQGLTGKGRVLAIGTWDFFGTDLCFRDADNYLFVKNLLEWLISQR